MRDLETCNVEAAAYLAREDDPPDTDRPSAYEITREAAAERPSHAAPPPPHADAHEGCV